MACLSLDFCWVGPRGRIIHLTGRIIEQLRIYIFFFFERASMMREYAMEVQSKAAAMQSTFHNIHEVRGSVDGYRVRPD